MKDFNLSFQDTKELSKLFKDDAKKIATKLNDGSKYPDISTTQFRQFYEKILELNDRAQGLEKDEFDVKVLPFVKLLLSKVEYSQSRGHCGSNFVNLMNSSIENVNSVDELKNFKYFLEAIIGYMPKR